jgi:predicted PurR-regulated permease PerM
MSMNIVQSVFFCYICTFSNRYLMFRKLYSNLSSSKLSMKMKLTFSLCVIAIVLLVSSIISIMEYSRMSHYVSDLIADNINSINVAERLANASNDYNLEILKVIGDTAKTALPQFKQVEFMAHCDSLKKSLTSDKMLPLADSVVYSYSAYMLTSLELKDVMLSDFTDARAWYFNRLQPKYSRLRSDIDVLNTAIYKELKKNSATFERGFYRSIIPGAVAVAVGLLLILLLLFFIMVYYVNPIYKMLAALKDNIAFGRKYNYTFDGDDQLTELNDGITEIIDDNQMLRKRLQDIRENVKKEDSKDK